MSREEIALKIVEIACKSDEEYYSLDIYKEYKKVLGWLDE